MVRSTGSGPGRHDGSDGALGAARRCHHQQTHPLRKHRRQVLTMKIRPYHADDLEEMRRITIEGFDGTAIDQQVERNFGPLGGHDWRWRKARQIDEDCEVNPAGVFVAEEDGKVLGYITAR